MVPRPVLELDLDPAGVSKRRSTPIKHSPNGRLLRVSLPHESFLLSALPGNFESRNPKVSHVITHAFHHKWFLKTPLFLGKLLYSTHCQYKKMKKKFLKKRLSLKIIDAGFHVAGLDKMLLFSGNQRFRALHFHEITFQVLRITRTSIDERGSVSWILEALISRYRELSIKRFS